MSEKSDETEFKKAITFLLSKEMKEYSLEKKKEFLLKKLPAEIVEKAISVYPTIEANINNSIEEWKIKKESSHNSISNFFNLSILSSVLLTTLGLNYLIDLNRNKKNDLFYKESEKKINEQLTKHTNNMKTEITNELSQYVTKESFKDKVQSQLTEFTQQKGLNFNLSTKSIKDEVVNLKKDLESKDKLLKELNVKIDNQKVLLKEDIQKETLNLIEDNNNKLLIKIIENQDKLLMMVSNTLKNNDTAYANVSSMKYLSSEQSQNNLNLEKKLPPVISYTETNTKDNQSKNEILIEDYKDIKDHEDADIGFILDSILKTISEKKNRSPFLKQLKNQFSAILEAVQQKDDSTPYINITNKIYKYADMNLLVTLFIKVGFKAESNSKYIFNGNIQDLNQAYEIIVQLDNKIENEN